MKEIINKIKIEDVCLVYLLIGSLYFGIAEKPTEMGLFILTGALSLAFTNIDRISRFKGAGFEAEMWAKMDKMDSIIEKETEPSTDNEEISSRCIAYTYDENTSKVIKCLGDSRYTWRTVSGIAKGSHLSVSEIKKSFSWLIENNLIRSTGTGKETKWALTSEGRELFDSM